MGASMSDMRKTFMVLAAGLAAAILVTSFFISNFGPSGTYELGNVLLAPDVLKQLNYNDWNTKINGQDRFIFDKIVYEGSLSQKPVDLARYGKIYQLLKSDKSVTDETGSFSQDADKLVIYVRTESPSLWQFVSKVIGQVQFAKDGNAYRVLLHEDNKGAHFVEFHHKNVKEQVDAIINE